MSKTAQIITWVILAVIVIGGIWWWSASQQATSPVVSQTSPTSQTATSTQNTAPNNNGISDTDNSNAALQADLSSTDSQMNGFSSDNASVNQGLNDQPVQQQQP